MFSLVGMTDRYQCLMCLFLSADAPVTTSASAPSCPKCGTVKKSGKRSCCARGGSWFKNCGDVGDSGVDHTWGEGMQACQSLESPQAMMSHEEAILPLLNNSSVAREEPTQEHANIYHPGDVSGAVRTDSQGCVNVMKMFLLFVCLCPMR